MNKEQPKIREAKLNPIYGKRVETAYVKRNLGCDELIVVESDSDVYTAVKNGQEVSRMLRPRGKSFVTADNENLYCIKEHSNALMVSYVSHYDTYEETENQMVVCTDYHKLVNVTAESGNVYILYSKYDGSYALLQRNIKTGVTSTLSVTPEGRHIACNSGSVYTAGYLPADGIYIDSTINSTVYIPHDSVVRDPILGLIVIDKEIYLVVKEEKRMSVTQVIDEELIDIGEIPVNNQQLLTFAMNDEICYAYV